MKMNLLGFLLVTFVASTASAFGPFCPEATMDRIRCDTGDPSIVHSSGPVEQTHPVNVTSGSTVERFVDTEVKTSAGTFPFVRTYVSQDRIWYGGATKEDGGGGDYYTYSLAGFPVPYGHSPTQNNSIRWWHNYFAVIEQKIISTPPYPTVVFDRGGASMLYQCPADLGAPCVTDSMSAGLRDVLLYTTVNGAGGFEFYQEDGVHLEYAYSQTLGTTAYYVLWAIYDVHGAKLAQLQYQDLNSSCQSISGQPRYLQSIQFLPDGNRLDMHYSQGLVNGTSECVLYSISTHDRYPGAASTDPTVVQYNYQSFGASTTRGLLSASLTPDTSLTTSYSNSFSSQPDGTGNQSDTQFLVQVGGGTMVAHTYTDLPSSFSPITRGVATAASPDSNWSFAYDSQYSNCPSPPTPVLIKAHAVIGSAMVGDGRTPAANYTNDFCATLEKGVHAAGLYQTNFMSTGNWITPDSDSSSGTVEEPINWGTTQVTGTQNASKGWTNLTWDSNGSQVVRVDYGASSQTATDQLLSEAYAYVNVATAAKPLVSQVTTSSSYVPGASAVDYLEYDTGSLGKLTKVRRAGWTKTWNGSAFVDVAKAYGVFIFYSHICSGDTTVKDLVQEIHGPCEPNANGTDCGAGDIPVTQFFYYPSNASGNLPGKLSEIKRFKGGVSAGTYNAVCSSDANLAISTFVDGYDALGNPTVLRDANGVVTNVSYYGPTTQTPSAGASSRVWKISTDSLNTSENRTTEFTYTNGKVTKIRRYDANLSVTGFTEVLCYNKPVVGLPTSIAAETTLINSSGR